MLGLSLLKTITFLKSLDLSFLVFFAVSLGFCYAKIFEIQRLIELIITSDIPTHFIKPIKIFNGVLVIKIDAFECFL
ncbi:hypothetical protein MM0348_10200 [Helicobacter pylori]